jgi:hypothetical protein
MKARMKVQVEGAEGESCPAPGAGTGKAESKIETRHTRAMDRMGIPSFTPFYPEGKVIREKSATMENDKNTRLRSGLDHEKERWSRHEPNLRRERDGDPGFQG